MRKLCNEWLGVTYNEYLLHKKFRKAMYALNYENHSLTEIAHNLDFYDSAHFTRTFKRFAGMTPKAYQNSQKGLIPEFIILE
jgi:AraC family transcriptional regulator